jgi:hypothetical protein
MTKQGTCNGKEEIQGSVRLRCSHSAVSNSAQDDVRFAVREENGQQQRQQQIPTDEKQEACNSKDD